jgi:hypothetical protein
MLRPMSPSRSSSLPRCAATRPGSGRRKPTTPRRCAAYGAGPNRARPPQERSWAGPARPVQADITTDRIRPAGPTPRPGRHARPRPGLAAAARTRLSLVFAQTGELMFARSDQEARWRAWDIQVRQAGLGRQYRDRRFNTLALRGQARDASLTPARV